MSLGVAADKAPAVTISQASRGSMLQQVKERVTAAREADTHGRAFQRLIDCVALRDVPELLSAVEKNPSKRARDKLRNMILSRWAEDDHVQALTYAQSIASETSKEQGMLAVIRGWAETDPVTASAWTQGLPSSQLRNQAMNAVVAEMAWNDPKGALDLLQTCGRSPASFGLVNSIFTSWAERDATTAAAATAELRVPQQKSEALRAVASIWASQSPDAAAEYAMKLPDGQRERFLNTLGRDVAVDNLMAVD